MVNIERMTVDHVAGVMVVENLCFSIPWSQNAFIEEISKNMFSRYVVALLRGDVVGYGGMWKVFEEGHITNIAVHPEFQRMGIASRILQGLFEIAWNEDIFRMTLEVRRGNIAAQKLYEKYGFLETGIRKAYYADNGEDAIIMWNDHV